MADLYADNPSPFFWFLISNSILHTCCWKIFSDGGGCSPGASHFLQFYFGTLVCSKAHRGLLRGGVYLCVCMRWLVSRGLFYSSNLCTYSANTVFVICGYNRATFCLNLWINYISHGCACCSTGSTGPCQHAFDSYVHTPKLSSWHLTGCSTGDTYSSWILFGGYEDSQGAFLSSLAPAPAWRPRAQVITFELPDWYFVTDLYTCSKWRSP